jgi:hypothetical protein
MEHLTAGKCQQAKSRKSRAEDQQSLRSPSKATTASMSNPSTRR